MCFKHIAYYACYLQIVIQFGINAHLFFVKYQIPK